MSNLSEVNVAILAGGFGTRLQSVVKEKPKVLARVRNHPFLEYLLHQLNKNNFKKIVLCTGYLADQIEKAFGERYKNLHLLYSKEPIPLGTGGCLRYALPLLTSDTILVMNGDSFCEVNFKKFWQFHLSKKSKATLVLSWITDTSRFGKVKLGNDSSIIGFQEKKEARMPAPKRSDGGQGSKAGLINAGIYLINKNLIAEIPQGKQISIEKDIFPNWIGKGFYGFKSKGRFIDIGIPQSYKEAEEFFSQHPI